LPQILIFLSYIICINSYSLTKKFFRDFLYTRIFQRKAVPIPVAKTELEMGFEILFVGEAF
jgi:hypothetical protein